MAKRDTAVSGGHGDQALDRCAKIESFVALRKSYRSYMPDR